MRALSILGLLVVASVLVAGCESTQSKSAKLEANGANLIKTEKVDIGTANKDIKTLEKVVLSDINGSAVAVVLKNESQEGLADAAISINVKGANGKSVYKNDDSGVETSLIQVPVMKAGGEVYWVNDQVLATSEPKTVEVTVGEAKRKLPSDLPEIEVSEPKLKTDPTSGIEAVGTVTNKSDIEQVDIVLHAIARKNGKIVAAGRGQVARLKTDGKPETYHIFFIGNPTGADVTVIAPPTTLD
ncbi:MAG: hypothetical protein ACSLFI_01880 [Solirubrobacterales bacterium]